MRVAPFYVEDVRPARRLPWWRRPQVEVVAVALLAAAAYSFVAYLLIVRLHLYSGDAVARTYSAKSMVLGSEPKLANVGFVWAPLPTLLQVPLVLVPALRYFSLAGGVLTALLGAGVGTLLLTFLRRVGVPGGLRLLLVAGYLLNPYIVLYSSNGMSEMTLVFFSLLAGVLYWHWRESDRWIYLAGAGLAATGAALARYDGVFVASGIALVVGIETVVRRPENLRYAEAALLLYGTPVAYGFSLWVLGNWLIMGDPLFFARSELSLAGRIGGLLLGREWILPLEGNIAATLRAGLRTVWDLFPAFLIGSALLLALVVWRREWKWLGLLLVAWSLLGFTLFNVYTGGSQYSLRYFISAIPMAVVVWGGVIALVPRRRTLMTLLAVAVIALSSLATVRAMRRPDPFDNDHRFLPAITRMVPAEVFETERTLAEYIDDRTQGLILVDDFQGNQLIIFSNHPERFITSSDSRFMEFLDQPFGHVDYILASEPGLYLDLVNRLYPNLYARGGDWVELAGQARLWKLYRVTAPADRLELEMPAGEDGAVVTGH